MHAIGGKSMPGFVIFCRTGTWHVYLYSCMHALFFVSKAAFVPKLKLCVLMFVTQAEKLVNIG